MKANSKYYSAKVSPRITGRELPHVTIQCPVYKEGLHSVIAPTVKSIKQAISTYELQGGSANMFINDDGLQLIDEDDRRARIEFYADHSIGWTARPKHGKDGFIRKGKFKKVRGHFIISPLLILDINPAVSTYQNSLRQLCQHIQLEGVTLLTLNGHVASICPIFGLIHQS